jgi:serine/threonine-protein kinase RsbW
MTEWQSHPGVTRIAFSFPAVPDSIGEVRHLILAEASRLPFSADDLDDIALAISEAFTNLVQHAHGYRIRGACEISADSLEVSFEVEQEIAQYMERRAFPAGLSSGGRGIPLLNLLIPEINIRMKGNGLAELRLKKPLAKARDAHEEDPDR